MSAPSTRSSDWTFELLDSSDLSGIGELTTASPRSLTRTLNKAGAVSCSMSMDEEISSRVKEITTAIGMSFRGKRVWTGPVWTTSESVDSERATLGIGCVGWLQTLDKRVTRPSWADGGPKTWTDTDAGQIAHEMLTLTNSDASTVGSPNYVLVGTRESTQLRTRTYQPWSVVLASLTELSDIESGFDMEVDSETRELNIYQIIQRNKGTSFQLDRNLQSVTSQIDAGRTLNWLDAYSSVGVEAVADPFSLVESRLV